MKKISLRSTKESLDTRRKQIIEFYERICADKSKITVIKAYKTHKKLPKDTHKIAAHSAVQKALRSKELKKPLYCFKCNKIKDLHAHHLNYDKPLLVIWLCVSCHVTHHVEERRHRDSKLGNKRPNAVTEEILVNVDSLKNNIDTLKMYIKGELLNGID